MVIVVRSITYTWALCKFLNALEISLGEKEDLRKSSSSLDKRIKQAQFISIAIFTIYLNLTRKDILKLLIIKWQMPVKSFGYLLCMYVWLQREAVCVCVSAGVGVYVCFNSKWHEALKSSGRLHIHIIVSSLQFSGIQVLFRTLSTYLTLSPDTVSHDLLF